MHDLKLFPRDDIQLERPQKTAYKFYQDIKMNMGGDK